jgi:predicted  nucleic acid-binding Zn-ribbon protein
MVPDLTLAIQLQDLDRRISDLQREIASLPKHIAAIERTLESHIRKLEADRAALAANQRERKRLEGDIQVQEQRISKLKDQMLLAKTNEQYTSFKHEIEYCEAEIRKCEDRILDRMSESEPLEQNVKKAEAALNAEKQQVQAEQASARERTASDQKQLRELHAERGRIAQEISPQVLSAYERIRKNRKGIAVAEAVEGRCSACHMALRLQFFQDLRRGDRVMFCESCGRILFYTPPPVEFENLGREANSEAEPVEAGRQPKGDSF